MLQKSLVGEWKIVCHVSHSGSVDAYLLHLPSTRSSFGSRLVSKIHLNLTDEELLEGDWGVVLERTFAGLVMTAL